MHKKQSTVAVILVATAVMLNAQATKGGTQVMAPPIIVANIVNGCSIVSPSSNKLVLKTAQKNVTMDLDKLTYSYYFSGSGQGVGLVFTFSPTTGGGSPIAFSIKADGGNKAAVRFAIPFGTYQLLVNDRLSSGAPGPSASPAYSVAVARCEPSKSPDRKLDPNLKQ